MMEADKQDYELYKLQGPNPLGKPTRSHPRALSDWELQVSKLKVREWTKHKSVGPQAQTIALRVDLIPIHIISPQ